MKFSSPCLNMYLLTKFKDKKEINENDLLSLEELELDPCGDHKYFIYPLEMFGLFPNLKKITFNNMLIDDDLINLLKNMKHLISLDFYNCTITNLLSLSEIKLTSISFNHSYIEDINILSNFKFLNEIKLINMGELDIIFLKDLPNLLDIYLSGSTILRSSLLNSFPLTEKIAIDDTGIKDLRFLESFTNLKELTISQSELINNEDIIKKLLLRKVTVYKDGFLYRGSNYE